MTALPQPSFQPSPDLLAAYREGWEIGRAGRISIPPKYPDQPDHLDAYRQGWFDAQAGRECSFTQDRTYPEDP